MKAFYCDHFVLPLPEKHRFPMAKYQRLRQAVVEQGLVAPDDLRVPPPASDEQILTAHHSEYLEQVKYPRTTRELDWLADRLHEQLLDDAS